MTMPKQKAELLIGYRHHFEKNVPLVTLEAYQALQDKLRVAKEDFIYCLGKFNTGLEIPEERLRICAEGAELARTAIRKIEALDE